ncbi:MAG: PSD1 and planctomycete cytochrome C domain-containing protein [Verrucomicrobiales bacterium]
MRTSFAAAGFALFLVAAPDSEAADDPKQVAFFEEKIRPVLVNHCYECHSPEAEEIESDYLLDTREGIRKGGASGVDAVIPGDVDGSQLVAAIRYGDERLQMPPEGKLPDAVIRDFETWVEMGAADPRDGRSRLPREIDADSHWSFQPPVRHDPPEVEASAWPRDAIDRFVLAELEKQGLAPADDADRATLLRRASLELTGLPPTTTELDAFLADPRPDAEAFEEVVDRLLAEPGFGERWGRHWLDVARFGESSGYSRNMLYPYAWRYRDWVIGAFNDDLPYDEFVAHQIAGDLLPAETPEERDRKIIATGFLTIGPKTLNESNPLLFELNVADDQIDATCRAFLALTANCARCHDHKYDPIPTDDYYALAGIFRSSRNLAGVATNVRAEHEAARPLGEDGDKRLAEIEAAHELVAMLQEEYKELLKPRDALRKELEEKGIDWKKNPSPELVAAETRVQSHKDKLAAAREGIPENPPFAMAVDEGRRISEEEWLAELEENKKKKKPTDPRIADSPVYVRGVHTSPADPVPRGVPTLFSDDLPAPEIGPGESGRLQLAEWIVNPENPLSARVYVNRVWHHLFGVGLVDTVDNFGLLGAGPSHPELLDRLALDFVADGWSTKRLVRRIVLTRTWQLSSAVNDRAHEIDPDGRLRWRFVPQRLEGEALRDSILHVGGGLDREAPASSQVHDIAMLQEKALQREIGRRDFYYSQVDDDVNHRSVYLPMARDAIFDSLRVFDSLDPNLVVGARKVITVPSQALFLLNSDLVREQSLSFAKRLVAGTPSLDGQIDLAFRTIYSREPSSAERTRLEAFFQGDAPDAESWATAVQALICAGEFRTLY